MAAAPSFGLGRRSITSTAYVPSKNHPKEVRRRVQVIIGPPPAFKYALFGAGCVTIGNDGSPIIGDVFSNGHVFLENGSKVTGDVYSSGGAVKLDNNSEVRKNGNKGGSVFSGGRASDPSCIGVGAGKWGINVDNGAVIERDAHAQRPSCAGSPPANEYGIKGGNTAKILGRAFSWGTVDAGINITGPITQPTCEVRPATVPLPGFAAFDPLNAATPPNYGFNMAFYDALAGGVTPRTIWDTTVGFKAWLALNKTNLRGIHFIKQNAINAAQVVDLTGATITDHFILVTPGRIYRSNGMASEPLFDNTSAPKRTVQLVSLVGPGILGIEIPENNIVINGQPCLLFYTTGMVDMKNNNLVNGAVYGGGIELKNGFKVAYDPCVDSSLGFGPALSLVQNIFTEINPSG